MMKGLVLGGRGMLGTAVAAHWRRHGQDVLALGREQVDITDGHQVAECVDGFQPDVIVNCAAFTQVDRCESEPETAFAINGEAVANIVAAAEGVGASMIHVSTDYVFDGAGNAPYPEDAPLGPRSVYGRSKLRGEELALRYPRSLVVRTSWLFGPDGPNFVATMRRLMSANGEPLRVVDDQVGCPTYTPYLAVAIWDLAQCELTGVVHYCNRDAVSWHGFACEIARLVAPQMEVRPVPTTEFPRPAPRPAYSVLNTHRFETAVGRQVETWKSGLAAYLA